MDCAQHRRGGTLFFSRPVRVTGFAAVGGRREREGPFGGALCETSEDGLFGEKTFEKAERRMQELASKEAAARAGLFAPELLLAGDLLNQCTASALAARTAGVPFLGLYGACSTMAESLLLGAALVDGGFVNSSLCVASSHFCSAERQYRFPLEYGGVRPPTAQWTVTGAGAAVLSTDGEGPRLRAARPGRVIDYGVADAGNMGVCMAPAACDTLCAFFRETGSSPAEFDRIFTGDLGRLGRDLLSELLAREGYPAGDRLCDCGTMIYDAGEQGVGMGGSGCGCSATVLCTYILPALRGGSLARVLFVATGALLSPVSTGQGENIPGIAHLILLEGKEGERE